MFSIARAMLDRVLIFQVAVVASGASLVACGGLVADDVDTANDTDAGDVDTAPARDAGSSWRSDAAAAPDADACDDLPCDLAPHPSCADDDTLVTYGNDGTCLEGSCSYPVASSTTCAFGCATGACNPDPCAGVTCTSPPSAICADGVTTRTFAPTGTCENGACVYPMTDTPCTTTAADASPRCIFGFCDIACHRGTACSNDTACCSPALVLFSGEGAGQDTWTFDGATWSKLYLEPIPERNGALSFGSLGDRAVLLEENGFDPSVSFTWIFDGRAWSTLPTAHSPPSREDSSMTRLGNDVVLYGGFPYSSAPALHDTWTFDGVDWTAITTPTPPPMTNGFPQMATLGDRAVLYTETTYYDTAETWTFDGADWTQVVGDQPGPPRLGFGMATVGSRVILFGGRGESSIPDDTWAFDGTTWSQLHPAHAPSARCSPAMATLGSVIVLYGGSENCQGTVSSYLDDTWVFDGDDWTELHPTTTPGKRASWRQMTVIE